MIQPVQRGAQILGVLGSGIPRLGVLTGQTKTTRAEDSQDLGPALYRLDQIVLSAIPNNIQDTR